WRRAQQIAQATGKTHISRDAMLDLVDRIDVIYVASQFLKNPSADLPGPQVLASFRRSNNWHFGGHAWKQNRDERRNSTSLSAAVNYGPGLKELGWLAPSPLDPALMIPNPAVAPALDALEAQIASFLDHEAFNAFGPVVVTRDEAASWADAWALENPTEA